MKPCYPTLAVIGCLAGTLSLSAFAQDEPPPPPPPAEHPAGKPGDDRPRDRARPDRRPNQQPRFSAEEWTRMEHRADETWNRLPAAEKVQVMRFHRAFKSMGDEERAFVRERIERFMDMSDQERQQLKENRERWKNLDPEQRDEVRREYRRRHHEFEQRWREEHPGEPPPPFHPRPGHRPPPDQP